MPKQSITTQVMDHLGVHCCVSNRFSIGPYYVCKELKSGKYRFVYFGLPMMQHLKVPLRSRLISITCLNTLHESIMLGFASVTRMA